MASFRVTVNGQEHEVPSGTTVAGLLRILGMSDPTRVAVERNREVVPRAQHAEATLAEGDQLEVVGFVGGG